MARAMISQCIYHLAISQSHAVKHRRNEQHLTCPNLILPFIAQNSTCCKVCTRKRQLDAVMAFPRKQEFCVIPLNLCVCPNILQ